MRYLILLVALLVPAWALALPTNYPQARFEWAYNDAGWGAQYFQIACGRTPGIYTMIQKTSDAVVRRANISILIPKINGTYYCTIRAVKGVSMTAASNETSFRVDGNWVYEK